jgi:hypothetical protein
MRYLLALILPPVAILSCGKPVSFLLNGIVYAFAWVFLVSGMFLAVVPFFGLGTLVPLPLAGLLWVLSALHGVLVVTAHVNEQRLRASGGRLRAPSAAFDWMLLVLVCAYFGWRFFFRTPPEVANEGNPEGRRSKAEKGAATRNAQGQASSQDAVPSAPPLPVATILPAEPVAAQEVTLEAQKRAMAVFPALAVPGSPLNREFVARYNRYRTEKPDFFTDPEWPTKLAAECAQAIGQKR